MATLPQLDVHSSMRKPGPWIIQNINPLSDGQASTWGAHPYRAISNDSYRVKVGSLWAKEKGIATAGKEARFPTISKILAHISSLKQVLYYTVGFLNYKAAHVSNHYLNLLSDFLLRHN